jgi:hypothetical protein
MGKGFEDNFDKARVACLEEWYLLSTRCVVHTSFEEGWNDCVCEVRDVVDLES